jgi:DNA topoisomerase-3
MRLFIAEKPSLARAIAQVLPLPQRRYRDHIQCGSADIVAWCAGHILEPVMPEHYDRKYARWALGDLPIVPAQWKLRASVPALLSGIKMLLRGASRVVHAGDPDREGQLLVDEVLEFLGYTGPIDRVLISDTNPDAVARQLAAIEPNAKYRSLGTAALARQRADWLYGINMTRLYSLLGQAAGYDRRVLSVGRVQTPLLGLIARRDEDIERFQPAPYYVVSAEVRTGPGEVFSARWSPEGQASNVDEQGRILRKDVAEGIVQRSTGAAGRVVRSERECKSEGPPLPYSLADLQIDAAQRLGLSAQAVLDTCQSLYETHRLTTYPRSDCSYLPEGHLAQGEAVLAAVANQVPDLGSLANAADLSLRSRAWNDKKVTAHHAIIPTSSIGRAVLSSTERAVYDLIARRYVSQFLAPCDYAKVRLELEIGGERFVATGRETLVLGWRKAALGASPEDGETEGAVLPALAEGDSVTVGEVLASDKETQSPKHFTDASLMQAMVNIAAHVSDLRVKAILTEADGIGTPATRPGIIETLFERGYVWRRGKAIVSTPIGRALAASLPATATTPDMTAEWEATMRAIAEGRETIDGFLARTAVELSALVLDAKSRRIVPPPPPGPTPSARPSARGGARSSRASGRPGRARG